MLTEASTPTTVIPAETLAPTETQVAVTLNGDRRWEQANRTPDGASIGVVITTELNIRDAPSLNGSIVSLSYQRHTVTVRTYVGHWVDVNLSEFYAIAYDSETPVYAAIIAAGRDGKTPIGAFHVFYQVADEVMDSATVGIPKGGPEYYYLEQVLYTQYFKEGGYAIHGNYWTPPSAFGGFTSNGCVGLMDHDAGWFFQLLSEGSMVNIHI